MSIFKPYLIVFALALLLLASCKSDIKIENSNQHDEATATHDLNNETVIRLSKELNSLEMYDYSEFVLKQEMVRNNEYFDLLKVQLAAVKFNSSKKDEADTLLSSIQPSSKYYPDARRLIGIQAVKNSKFEIAAEALEDYFKVYSVNLPKTQTGRRDYVEAANYLTYAYKKLNRTKDYVTHIDCYPPTESEKDRSREILLGKIKADMDTAERMITTKDKEWEKIVEGAIKKSENLIWVNDLESGLAYIERARGYYYLGDYQEAEKSLVERNIEKPTSYYEIYLKQGTPDLAPSVYRDFWLGKIYLAKAEKAQEPDKVTYYAEAIKYFYPVLSKHEKFPRYGEALADFIACRNKLSAAGKKIVLPKSINDKIEVFMLKTENKD